MNLLFVFSDQQRYSALGANGNPVVRTPNLDRMAAEGLVCDNMFSNHPLCSPFRAILLTGRYGWRNGVIDNEYEPFRDIPTLPGVLHSAGYHTGHIGVWHLGVGPYPAEDRYGLDYLAAVEGVGGNYFDQRYFENERGPTLHSGWSPASETDLAVRFLENHTEKRQDDPFALFVSWRPPHWPYPQYPDEYGLYDPADVDLPANVPRQMADFARREIADYYACCTGLDAQMGRLLDALERLGLAEDTVVCYSSDHGDHLSSHGYGKPMDGWMHHSMRASKATPYDESAHIPFLVRWPGAISPGSRSAAFMGAIDMVPSLLGRVRRGATGRSAGPGSLRRVARRTPPGRDRLDPRRQRIGLPDEHGQRLAEPSWLGRALAWRPNGALHVCPLVRQRARTVAIRSRGGSAGDAQHRRSIGGPRFGGRDGGPPAPLDGSYGRPLRVRASGALAASSTSASAGPTRIGGRTGARHNGGGGVPPSGNSCAARPRDRGQDETKAGEDDAIASLASQPFVSSVRVLTSRTDASQ